MYAPHPQEAWQPPPRVGRHSITTTAAVVAQVLTFAILFLPAGPAWGALLIGLAFTIASVTALAFGRQAYRREGRQARPYAWAGIVLGGLGTAFVLVVLVAALVAGLLS